MKYKKYQYESSQVQEMYFLLLIASCLIKLTSAADEIHGKYLKKSSLGICASLIFDESFDASFALGPNFCYRNISDRMFIMFTSKMQKVLGGEKSLVDYAKPNSKILSQKYSATKGYLADIRIDLGSKNSIKISGRGKLRLVSCCIGTGLFIETSYITIYPTTEISHRTSNDAIYDKDSIVTNSANMGSSLMIAFIGSNLNLDFDVSIGVGTNKGQNAAIIIDGKNTEMQFISKKYMCYSVRMSISEIATNKICWFADIGVRGDNSSLYLKREVPAQNHIISLAKDMEPVLSFGGFLAHINFVIGITFIV